MPVNMTGNYLEASLLATNALEKLTNHARPRCDRQEKCAQKSPRAADNSKGNLRSFERILFLRWWIHVNMLIVIRQRYREPYREGKDKNAIIVFNFGFCALIPQPNSHPSSKTQKQYFTPYCYQRMTPVISANHAFWSFGEAHSGVCPGVNYQLSIY